MEFQASGVHLSLHNNYNRKLMGLLTMVAVFLAGPRVTTGMPEKWAESPTQEPNCRAGGTLRPVSCEPGSFCVYVTPHGTTPAQSDVSALGYCMNEAMRSRVCIVGGEVDQVACPRGSVCKIAIHSTMGMAKVGLCTYGPPDSEGVPEGVPLGGTCGHGGFVFPPAPRLPCQEGLKCKFAHSCKSDLPCYGKCVLPDGDGDALDGADAPGPEPAPAPAGAEVAPAPGPETPVDRPPLASSCVFGGGRRPRWCPRNFTCVPRIRGTRLRPSVGVCIPKNIAGSYCVLGGNVPQVPCTAPDQQCMPLVEGSGSYATVGICQAFKPAAGRLGAACHYSPKRPMARVCAVGLQCKPTPACDPDKGCDSVCTRRAGAYIPLGQKCAHGIRNLNTPQRKCAPGLRCSRPRTCSKLASDGICYGVCERGIPKCRDGGNVLPLPCAADTTCVYVTSGSGDVASTGYCLPNKRLERTCVFGGEVQDIACDGGEKCVPTIPGGPGEATIGTCLDITG